MKTLACMTLVAVSAVLCFVQSAPAISQFGEAFSKKYVEANDNAEFVAAVKKAKCNVCHVGKDRKDRNAYGMALAELLDKKSDENNLPKINEALDKVADMKAPGQEKTFGELNKKGKLPGGEIK